MNVWNRKRSPPSLHKLYYCDLLKVFQISFEVSLSYVSNYSLILLWHLLNYSLNCAFWNLRQLRYLSNRKLMNVLKLEDASHLLLVKVSPFYSFNLLKVFFNFFYSFDRRLSILWVISWWIDNLISLTISILRVLEGALKWFWISKAHLLVPTIDERLLLRGLLVAARIKYEVKSLLFNLI